MGVFLEVREVCRKNIFCGELKNGCHIHSVDNLVSSLDDFSGHV